MPSKTRRTAVQRASRSQDFTASQDNDDDDDPGRTESQRTLAILKAASNKSKAKDEFVAHFREKMQTDKAELEKLIEERSSDSERHGQQEHAKFKEVVKSVASAAIETSSTPPRLKPERGVDAPSERHSKFLFDTAESILDASAGLLKEYDNVNSLPENDHALDSEEIHNSWLNDQREAETLIRTGKTVAMRRIERAVEGKTGDLGMNDGNETPANKRPAETCFGEDRPVDRKLLQMLRNAEKGMRRLTKDLPSD